MSPFSLQQTANVHDRAAMALATNEASAAFLERPVVEVWAIAEAAQHVMTRFLNYEIAGKQRVGLSVQDCTWALDFGPGDPP